MKKIKIGLFIFLASYSMLFAQNINIENSSIAWNAKKVTGEHDGFIKLKSGNIDLVDNSITNGKFVVDMSTITCTDIENEVYNKKLVNHLKSEDFFGVDNFPTAEFIVVQSDKFVNNKATVTGKITIKGKTETISFEVYKNENEYSANIEIDRSKFDVKYRSKSFFDNLGDKVIDDIFTLKVKLVLK